MLGMTKLDLEKADALNTVNEIFQQPKIWKQLFEEAENNKAAIEKILSEMYSKNQLTRVIFTGAGTSSYIGDILVPELTRRSQGNVLFEAVPTTDIVANPTNHFIKEVPTILVSFARSGNSPESMAAVELGSQLVNDIYHVVFTCNKDGMLAKKVKELENGRLILLPEETNDKGFAMTSSFTSMVLLSYLYFSCESLTFNVNAEKMLDKIHEPIDEILNIDFERIIYLGSGIFAKLSQEAALKMLELTAGKVVSMNESSLGFRHGPKSILNEKTLVFLFMSQDPYTRKYDVDILKEIATDSLDVKIVALDEKRDKEVEQLANWYIPMNVKETSFTHAIELALLYILFAQSFALKKSLQLGITPGNPSPDGRVNRVVKGVTIYPYPASEN